ncbi:MAG TPA: hypothetical protein VK574_10205 [Terracidiphilus sp.]|nr:hypothetical protein [Terracidiphilus sp.]
MAAVSNNVRNLKPDRHRTVPSIQDAEEMVEIALQPEVLKKVTAAAKSSGQTPSEWILEAVVEAIARKSKERSNPVGPKQ